MDIDWPRTLTVGGITAAVMVAIYLADTYEALRAGEGTAGLAPLVGMTAGLVAGLLVANVLFA